jgi:hypothetical protein
MGCILNSQVATPVFVSYFFVIGGSSNTPVKIKKIGLSATQTTTGNRIFALYLGNTLNGGTPTTVIGAAKDTNDNAYQASLLQFSSGTTPSFTSQIPIRAWSMMVPSSSMPGATFIEESFGDNQKQDIVLRGTNQYLAFALIGGALTGGAVNAYISWQEP